MPNFSTFVKRFKGHNSNSETSNLPAGKFSKTRYIGENKNGKKRSKQSRYFSESEIPKRTIPEIEVYDATGGRLSESKNSVSHWKRGSRLIINLGWGRKKSLDNDKSDAQTSSKIANTGISMRPTASAAVLGNRPSEGHLSAKGRIPLRMSEVSLATYRAMLPSKLSDISLTSYFGVSRYSSSVSFTSYPSTSAFKVQCNLCLCDIPSTDMYELQDCKCVFCKECMVQYVSIHVHDGNVVISCPDANCLRKGVLSCTEVESLLDKEVFDKFLRFKFNTEVDQDPTKTWCPSPGCETVCHVSVKEGSKFPPSARCDKCGHQFCSRCKRQCHPNQTCDEFAKLNATQSLVEIGMSSGEGVQLIKRCPVCRVPIERNEGCAQMMCKRCKHVFCWYCLTSLDDDFLLRHYDKGPCKNKLGHSRASIIWHRAQVIGIFAGFGVLLLVASPLLLLAAPCILCCKCTTCNKYCEENSESSTITEN